MWITDDNGNRASVEYWGTEEKARESLATLVNCRDCSNCSSCSDCTSCYFCTRCTRCTRCAGCRDCSDCCNSASCFHCHRCSDCFRCYRLSDGDNYFRRLKYYDKLAVPIITNIHKRLYGVVTADGNSLDMSQWHRCATTHCRAGWVVTLAGEDGARLERRLGTLLAAMKIYDASCPGFEISPCRFFDSNEEALEDMKRLAEEQTK